MNLTFWRPVAAAFTFIVLTSSSTATSSLFVAYRTQWGLSTADIAIVFAAYVGTLVPVLLVFGGLADRFGRRRTIVAGILSMVAGLVTLTLAHGLPLLIVARFFQGIGAGLAIGAITAAFSESYRGKLPAGNAIQSVTAVALAAGPVVTAVAFDLGGGPNLSYLPMLILAVGILALTPLFKKPRADAGTPQASEEPFSSDIVGRALRFAMPLVFISWAGLSLYLSLVPSYLFASLHAANPLIGAGAFVAAQLASLLATLRLGSVAPERSGIIAPVVIVAGLVLLVVGTDANIPLLIGVATILVGAGGGVASAAAFAVVGRVARGQRARLFARMYVAGYLGYSLPALAVGLIAARASLTAGFTSVIVAIAILTAVLPLLRTSNPKPACRRENVALAA